MEKDDTGPEEEDNWDSESETTAHTTYVPCIYCGKECKIRGLSRHEKYCVTKKELGY